MLVIGYFTMRNGSQSLLFQIVFCGSFLFILNKTLEINEYLFKTVNPDDYSLEGMTEEGKRGMQDVFENMRKQNERTMSQRIVEMNRNFRSNFGYDLSIIYMVVTNNKKMQGELSEIHKIMGNDTAFNDMKMVDMLSMVTNRIQVDACVVVSTGLMALL